MELSNGSMLLVRFILFGCGGTAVSILLTHKIADMATLNTILQTWTAACRARTEPDVLDLGLGASLFPPRDIPEMMLASVNMATEKFTARRFVFTGSKLGELKSRVVAALIGRDKSDEDNIQFHPSRVEVVLALIWRCAMLSSRSKTGSFKPSALFQAVNLRPRMEPPVPGTAIGNFVWPFAVTVEEEKEMELHELVKKMREGMKEFIEKANKFREGGGFEAVMEFLKERGEMLKKREETVIYKCSSWCRFPLYEVDYGWGSPVWMSSVNKLVSNTIAFMDLKDGGVEALVTLNENEMDIFEQHHELLQYAQLNPSIVM